MNLIPIILNFEDSIVPLTVGHQVTAGRLAWDAKLLYDRETKRSMMFNPDAEGNPIHSAHVVQVPQKLPQDVTGRYMWERGALVRQTDDDWYNIGQWLHDFTEFDWDNDIIVAWLNANPFDPSGIGGPARAAKWNDQRDPDIGGLALNGIGQVVYAMESNLRGSVHRRSTLYASHEIGHALGEHHSGFDELGYDAPTEEGYLMTLLGYGYNLMAAGLPDSRTGRYVEEEGMFSRLQRDRIASHSVFVDRPDETTAMHASTYDSKEIRLDTQESFAHDIATGIATPELLARMIVGPMQSESGSWEDGAL